MAQTFRVRFHGHPSDGDIWISLHLDYPDDYHQDIQEVANRVHGNYRRRGFVQGYSPTHGGPMTVFASDKIAFITVAELV